MAVAPVYRVFLYEADPSDFSPGDFIAEFQDAKNVGWGNYLNDVPEAFFTLAQDDPKLDLIVNANDVMHVLITRDGVLVFGGIFGEWSANETDAVITAYGYLSLFYFICSDWDVEYVNATIKTIVDDFFTRAQTGLTSTLSEWLTSGTVEATVTTSGGATPITLPTYKMFYKRFLFMLREMAALSIGDTTNSVVFEVTPAGVFNFWKARSTNRTNIVLQYGDGYVEGFDEQGLPVSLRTDILGVGLAPNDVLLRKEVTTSLLTTRGRRQEPVMLSWVRDSLEMDRVLNQRALSNWGSSELWVKLYPNKFAPPGIDANLRLGDIIYLRADRGITQNNASARQITGHQTVFVGGNEHVHLRLARPVGT